MATPLYARFLADESEYAAAERFWKEVFDQVVRPAEAGDWRPWRSRTYADGTPLERDGNPIFDARNRRLGRALQVIQWPCESQDVEISAWISELPVDDGEVVGMVSELTVNLSLSMESAAHAKSLIAAWVDGNVPADEVRQRISRLPTAGEAGG